MNFEKLGAVDSQKNQIKKKGEPKHGKNTDFNVLNFALERFVLNDLIFFCFVAF